MTGFHRTTAYKSTRRTPHPTGPPRAALPVGLPTRGRLGISISICATAALLERRARNTNKARHGRTKFRPSTNFSAGRKTWMPGSSPGMTKAVCATAALLERVIYALSLRYLSTRPTRVCRTHISCVAHIYNVSASSVCVSAARCQLNSRLGQRAARNQSVLNRRHSPQAGLPPHPPKF